MIGIALRLLAPFWRPIAALFAGLAAYWKGRADAKAKAEAEAMKDAAKRAEAGRKAQGRAQDDMRKGASPDDVVRRNDGKWK